MDKGLGVTHTVAKRRENTREIFPNATPLSSSSHSVEIQEYSIARISDEKNVIEITNLNCGLRKRLRSVSLRANPFLGTV